MSHIAGAAAATQGNGGKRTGKGGATELGAASRWRRLTKTFPQAANEPPLGRTAAWGNQIIAKLRQILALALGLIVIGAPMAAAAGPEVFIAHRGMGGESQIKYGLPENSLPAWKWAHDHEDPQYPTIYDLDVQVSSDGVFMIMHDTGSHALRRTTNGDGSVRDHTAAYIKSRWLELPQDLDGNGNDDNTPYHPPTLSQALKQIGPYGAKITLETKGSGWTQTRMNSLKAYLRDWGVLDRTIVHSFDLQHVSWAKTAGIPLRGYVAPSDGPMPSVTTVQKYGSYVFIKYSIATPEKMSEYKAAGIKVCIWTMDNGGEYADALALGDVYAWVVDDLIEARDYLKAVA